MSSLLAVRHVWVPAAVLIGGLTASARARAFDFGWDVPGGCPSSAFVEAEVTRIVGRPWQELGAAWREAQATITEAGGSYRLRLRIVLSTGASSERSVVAGSCTEATEAAVAILTAGMALSPSAAAGEPAPLPAAGSAQVAASAGGATQGAADTASGVADTGAVASSGLDGPRFQPTFAARLGVDLNTLAAPAPFAQITGGIGVGRVEVLGFVGVTGRVIGEVEGAAAGAQMFLFMGGLMGCYRFTLGNPSASGCGGVELGSLEASGFGAADGKDGRAFWSASFAQGALDWNVTDASVASIGLTVLVPFQRLHVMLSPEEVHQTPSVALRPWLGLAVRFP